MELKCGTSENLLVLYPFEVTSTEPQIGKCYKPEAFLTHLRKPQRNRKCCSNRNLLLESGNDWPVVSGLQVITLQGGPR